MSSLEVEEKVSILEDLANPLLPEKKYSRELTADQEMEDLTERPKGQPIHNPIDHFCAIRSFNEIVCVHPLLIWTPDLNVNKSAGGIPEADQGGPSEGDAIESQTIVDTGFLTHLDGRRREDSKAKLWGCDPLEVQSVGKESENPRNR
jgi:hypothetical protein